MSETGTETEDVARVRTSRDSCGPIAQLRPTTSAPASARARRLSAASSPKLVLPSARNVIDAKTGISGREGARGAQGLEDLERGREGLEEEEVDLLLEEDPDLLREDLADVRARERPVRLHELAERADDARDVDVFTFRRGVRELHGRPVDLLERVCPVELRELGAVRVPRVRRDDLRAGRHVVVVDLADEVRRREGDRRARAVRGGAARDEERAHRAVPEEDLGLQALADVFLHENAPSRTKGRGTADSASISSFSRRPRPGSGIWHLRPARPGALRTGCRGIAGPVPPPLWMKPGQRTRGQSTARPRGARQDAAR